MSNFEKTWKKGEEGESFAKRTREAVRGPQPIKPQIEKASAQLQSEVNRLDVGEITGTNFSLGEPNEDAQKILAEASAIAEKRVNETFPDVPASNADEPIFTSGEQG